MLPLLQTQVAAGITFKEKWNEDDVHQIHQVVQMNLEHGAMQYLEEGAIQY